ncbi:hypothetical protein KOPIIPEJ_00468 [Aeromonas dhakensis]
MVNENNCLISHKTCLFEIIDNNVKYVFFVMGNGGLFFKFNG